MLSPGRTGFSQRRSSTPAPNKGCGPNGLQLAASRMAIAAVCHPDAARPPRIDFFAASSSRWKGCGSYSLAKRRMSSFDTVTALLLKRMPTFRSSNHSTIPSNLPDSATLALLRGRGSEPDLHRQPVLVKRRHSFRKAAGEIACGNRDRAGIEYIVSLRAGAYSGAGEPAIDLVHAFPLEQGAAEPISFFRSLRRQRLTAVE